MEIITIYTNDKYCSIITMPVDDGKWWNAVEEALYINFELLPMGRYWRQELARGDEVTFTYGGTEFFKLHRRNESTFEIYF